MKYFYDIFGWYIGNSNGNNVRRFTRVRPNNMSTSSEPGMLRSNWSGRIWIEKPYKHMAMSPNTINVPQYVTKKQAAIHLYREGLLTALETSLRAHGGETLIAYETTAGFNREDPLLIDFLKNNEGMADEDIDQWFIDANKIR